ncbi:MAG: BspA family leucine-rich repeat surface protein, partial [Lactobacillus sp.]
TSGQGNKNNSLGDGDATGAQDQVEKTKKVAPSTTSDGLDKNTYGSLNVDDWDTTINDNYLNITGYHGDKNSEHLIIPNGADFFNAGKNSSNLEVAISQGNLENILNDMDDLKSLAVSKTNNDKVKWNDTSLQIKNNWRLNYLVNLELNNLDVSDVTDMESALSNLAITNTDGIKDWDVSHVENMRSMFSDDSQLSDLSGLSKWNVSHVENMGSMFNDDSQLSDLSGLSNWNVSNVMFMTYMFNDDPQLSDISGLSNWNIVHVTDMNSMFSGDSRLSNLSGISNWDVSHVESMDSMFSGDSQLSDLSGISNWNVSHVESMKFMFSGDPQLSNVTGLSNWDVSNVIDMGYMFSDDSQLSDLSGLSNWDVSHVENMSYMFNDDSQLSNVTGLSNWNVSHVTDMNSMFNYATRLSDVSGLSNWKLSSVNMADMFANDLKLSDVSALSGWDVSAATNLEGLFSDTLVTDMTPLKNWKLDSTNNYGDGLFYYMFFLEKVDISNWHLTCNQFKNLWEMSICSNLHQIIGFDTLTDIIYEYELFDMVEPYLNVEIMKGSPLDDALHNLAKQSNPNLTSFLYGIGSITTDDPTLVGLFAEPAEYGDTVVFTKDDFPGDSRTSAIRKVTYINPDGTKVVKNQTINWTGTPIVTYDFMHTTPNKGDRNIAQVNVSDGNGGYPSVLAVAKDKKGHVMKNEDGHVLYLVYNVKHNEKNNVATGILKPDLTTYDYSADAKSMSLAHAANGNTYFDELDTPEIAGYTPSLAKIDQEQIVVHDGTPMIKNADGTFIPIEDITITYTANKNNNNHNNDNHGGDNGNTDNHNDQPTPEKPQNNNQDSKPTDNKKTDNTKKDNTGK